MPSAGIFTLLRGRAHFYTEDGRAQYGFIALGHFRSTGQYFFEGKYEGVGLFFVSSDYHIGGDSAGGRGGK